MNEFAFRDELQKRGATNIIWDGENNGVRANLGGKTYFYDTSSLENRDGTLYGSREQIDGVLNNPLSQLRNTAVSQGINVQNYGSKPYLNGQEISTEGMVLSGDRWYGNENAINEIAEGVKPKEYTSSYSGIQNSILQELLGMDEFSYNPEDDLQLQKDMGFARRQAMRDAVNRGQGSSFGMEYAATSAANSLIPKYREMAYEEYKDGRSFLEELLTLTEGFEQNEYERFKSDRQFNEGKNQADNEYLLSEKEFGLDEKKYGLSEQEFGLQKDRFGLEEKEFELEKDRFGLEEKEFGLEEKGFELEKDRFGLEKDKFGLSEKEFGLDEKKYSLSEKEYQDNYALKVAESKLNGQKFDSEEEQREFNNALKMSVELGYVTEKNAKILGVEPGTKMLGYLNYLAKLN